MAANSLSRLSILLALAVLTALACRRPAEEPPVRVAQPELPADPVVAEVDTLPLRWSQLAERLGPIQAEMGPGKPEAAVRAAALAASDLLVLREMRVVGALAQATETAAQASDRLLRQTFNDEHGCAVGETEVRLYYMENLPTYKHPPAWTVWDAAGQCCERGEGCPIAEVEQCRSAIRQQLTEFARQLRGEYAQLPPLGLAAQASNIVLDETPLRFQYLPRFEQLLADFQQKDRRLRILRYTFWQQGLPAYQGARFRSADPAVQSAVQKAELGEVLGPLDGEDSPHVLVLAARQPESVGLPHTPTAATEHPVAVAIRHKLCDQWAARERTEYRERLLGGAQLIWHGDALRGHLEPVVIDKLIKQLASPTAPGVR